MFWFIILTLGGTLLIVAYWELIVTIFHLYYTLYPSKSCNIFKGGSLFLRNQNSSLSPEKSGLSAKNGEI